MRFFGRSATSAARPGEKPLNGPALKPAVFIFCALACEARPLISVWQLKKLTASNQPFTIYADARRAVVVTGIGKVAMAGAIGYAMALFAGPAMPVMLNLGIAGHRHRPLASLVLAHKIIDIETGRCFYPQLPFSISVPTHAISTHPAPNADYAADDLFDMEASGFYEMAIKFSSNELIHAVKIISDNQRSPVTAIKETLVEQWITQQLPAIEALLETLMRQNAGQSAEDSQLYERLLKEFRFTVSGCFKLKALLRRWRVLKGDEPLIWQNRQLKSGKEFLRWLEEQLDETRFYL